ncbi:MAG: YjcG family protein [Exiguobacterium sp.]|uniref:Putative phosphoesterase NQG31_13990 n=1 Tax=Exiguobacterium alkaliphilum TaxID=1428684 RepID=A0ABT2L187_9BACL|nr:MULTISPECIES: YjcG family protein [Exiguobacterium]MDX5323630.1 YjcG family protein [Exiguobacterium sp.]MCT4796658.1 YjcG family protein [Exiguobacterium alkaliphilum]MDX5425432.1 YjcG family protein [Exiguobacterium sp.]MDX6772846.1 YjcG family protein [Exiguobacterium sp.]QUE85801.1 YjcG family protein [Exiguobacterium alkaliphilum]
MKIGVVLFPSKQVQDFANSYRKRYDTKYALISPHVTVKERTEVDEADLPRVLEYLQQVADETKPIQLKIDGVRSFAPTNNVLYLKVLPTRELATLQQKLHEGVLNQPPKYEFLPHITIGQDLADAELFDVLERMRMEQVHFEETITRMAVMYELENETWNVYETFRFRG